MENLTIPDAQTWGEWLAAHRTELILAILVLFLLVGLQRVLAAIRRRRPPADLHPRLAAYAGKSAKDIEADRKAAELISATSSTGRIAGYELVRQVEAVYVEGYRTPEEAVVGLKAAAGRLGANAIINLSQQRSTSGRCTAQGDAVVVRVRGSGVAEPPKAQPPNGEPGR